MAGALDALPTLPLDAETYRERARATGTDPSSGRRAAALIHGNDTTPQTIAGNMNTIGPSSAGPDAFAASASPGKEKGPPTIAVSGPLQVGAAGFEPTTSRPPV